jgi:hypothetical protein
MANIDELTKLPAPSSPAPAIASGVVALYKDNNWSSQNIELRLSEYESGMRHTVPNALFDSATYVAFNLPVGTVMTLMDNIASVEQTFTVANLRQCGRCVDLVGTGKTEAVNLVAVNMNDCVSSFFWRKVDLDLGAIELFEDDNFQGGRSTLFLSEWNTGTVYSLSEWWLQDKISSIRWKMLKDRQTAQFFDNADGSGSNYSNVKGYGDIKEIASLRDIRLNDCISSFRWDEINPKKEVIAPFEVKSSTGSDAISLTSTVNGTNKTSLSQPVTVSLNDTESQTVTVSTTDTFATGIKASFSQKFSAVGNEKSWSVEVSFSYTRTQQKTTSQTQTIGLSLSEVINAPPNTNYSATLEVTIGKIPATVFSTTATRWYDQPVTGGEVDPSNNGWYKRVEPITVTISGGLVANTSVKIEATPISA